MKVRWDPAAGLGTHSSIGGYAHVYLTSSTYPIGPDRFTQHCLKRIAFTDKEMLKDVKREIDTMVSCDDELCLLYPLVIQTQHR